MFLGFSSLILMLAPTLPIRRFTDAALGKPFKLLVGWAYQSCWWAGLPITEREKHELPLPSLGSTRLNDCEIPL